MVNDNTLVIRQFPIDRTLRAITDKWDKKYSKSEVGLKEYLSGIHNE